MMNRPGYLTRALRSPVINQRFGELARASQRFGVTTRVGQRFGAVWLAPTKR